MLEVLGLPPGIANAEGGGYYQAKLMLKAVSLLSAIADAGGTCPALDIAAGGSWPTTRCI
jgi:hypothetical protein